MLDSYRRVVSRPGARAFSSAALIARLPMSMVGIGIVLLVEARTGSYGLAGSVSAVCVLAQASFAVLHGRWVDSFGQSRVLPLAVTVFAAGLALMTVSVDRGWSLASTYAFAALTGAAVPQVGACVRTRWSHLLEKDREVQTAFALEAVLDELVFVVGPVLVTVLATAWDPAAGLTVAGIAAVVGTYAFAAQRRTEPPSGRHSGTVRQHAMPWRLVLPLAGVCALLGLSLGAAEVTTIAFAQEEGAQWAAGPLLAAWALGSLLAGIVTGAVHWRAGPATRLQRGTIAMASAMAPLPFVESVPLMAVLLFVGGMAIAPTLISTMTLAEQRVPSGRLTEGIAVLHTGLVAGVAPGAALAGYVVDHGGSSAAFLVALGGGLVASVVTRATPSLPKPPGKGTAETWPDRGQHREERRSGLPDATAPKTAHTARET